MLVQNKNIEVLLGQFVLSTIELTAKLHKKCKEHKKIITVIVGPVRDFSTAMIPTAKY